jgi:hypothetical protein
VRREAAQHGLIFQDRPPYYVLGTGRLSYAELRRLRRELKLGVGLDPDEVEGMPEPRLDALSDDRRPTTDDGSQYTQKIRLERDGRWSVVGGRWSVNSLACHVDIILPADQLAMATPGLAAWMTANPSTVFDIYLEIAGEPPAPEALRLWLAGLPYTPGYLDRVAVYAAEAPEPAHVRAGLRLWLVLPWVAQADPGDYVGVAGLIWRYELEAGQELPLGAWRSAGGAGVALAGADAEALRRARAWAEEHGRMIWAR